MVLVAIKYFNALIENEMFFNQSMKNKKQSYEQLIEMSRNNNYTTGNLLSRQTNTSIPQQISFTGELKKMMVHQCFFRWKAVKKIF